MFRLTLREKAAHASPARIAALVAVVALVLTGCGGGSNKRQDENEPEGEFPVEIVDAKFPTDQKLAKNSVMEISVKNAGTEEIPNIAITVDDFYYRKDFAPGQEDKTGLADPERPVFVIDRIPTRPGPPERDTERLDPLESSSAYVDTYPLGELGPGDTATFKWEVTAVKAGPFCISYRVAAGLDGKAEAVLRDAQPRQVCRGQTAEPGNATDEPGGAFAGVISDKPPQARIAADGETVIRE
jgi:hypothetical protein